MRKLIALSMLFLSANSQSVDMQDCVNISSNAGKIMVMRQNNYDMIEVFERYSDPAFKNMIIDAYDETGYQTLKYQKRAVARFKNLWFKRCVKHIK